MLRLIARPDRPGAASQCDTGAIWQWRWRSRASRHGASLKLQRDMARGEDQQSQGNDEAGPRAILRVPEVLSALASKRAGSSLAELSQQLNVPKTSLHRLLRTLERGGYLVHQTGVYSLGPTSFRLANLIGQAAPSTVFPACARPVLEWLAT